MNRSRKTGHSGHVYWIATALALAGAGMLALAVRSPSDAPSGPAAEGPPTAVPALGQREPPHFPVRFDSLGIALGAEDAPVVLREFSDYQCPACGSFAPTAERLRREYVQTGRVRFVLFDFPLTQVHSNALVAAQAARCAGAQDRYWAMHDALFDHQSEWSQADEPVALFARYAEQIAIDEAALRSCVTSGATLAAVEHSAAFGQAIGIRGTPTILVNDAALPGVPSYDDVRARIEAALAEAGS